MDRKPSSELHATDVIAVVHESGVQQRRIECRSVFTFQGYSREMSKLLTFETVFSTFMLEKALALEVWFRSG
jgi:hypothetical protein